MNDLRLWFRPSMLGLHLTVLLALVVCGFAGMWQLGVYDARQSDEQADKGSVPVRPLTDIWGPDETFSNLQTRRPVTFSGEFAPAEEQFWVTERADGSVWLVAPVEVEGSILFVVRGQTDAVGDLPPVPEGDVDLTGVLQPTETVGERWDPQTRTIGTLRLPTLVNEFDQDLWGGFVVSSTPEVSGGLDLVPEPEPEPQTSWTTGGRSLGYGLQWWAFGIFAIFMWWRMATDMIGHARIERDERAAEAEREAALEAERLEAQRLANPSGEDVTDTLEGVQPSNDRLLLAYQVMATIVGVNLIIVMAGFIGKLTSEVGSFWHRHADTFFLIDQLHGFLFMALIILAAKLTLRQRWSWGYLVSIILLACIPLASFWAERRTTRRVRSETSPSPDHSPVNVA